MAVFYTVFTSWLEKKHALHQNANPPGTKPPPHMVRMAPKVRLLHPETLHMKYKFSLPLILYYSSILSLGGG